MSQCGSYEKCLRMLYGGDSRGVKGGGPGDKFSKRIT